MNWNLKCRRMRRLLALSAGNDLEAQERTEAERHLAVCPGCREHWTGLQSGQQALDSLRSSRREPVELPVSVWPAVHRHMRSREEVPLAPQWHGWLPVGALAAACLAILVTTSPGLQSPMAADRSPIVIRTSPVDRPLPPLYDGPGEDWRGARPIPGMSPRRPLQLQSDPVRVETLIDGRRLQGL